MMFDVDRFIALGQFKEVAIRDCTKAPLAIQLTLRLPLGLNYWFLALSRARTEKA